MCHWRPNQRQRGIRSSEMAFSESVIRRATQISSGERIVVKIARQLCAALASAHEQGVLHRDLKPQNIMVDGRGRARITDLGLAQLSDDVTRGLQRGGTPAYVAPEQLQQGESSVQSDLYSLGLIMYEIFTGKVVFKSESLAGLMEQHANSSPMQPTESGRGTVRMPGTAWIPTFASRQRAPAERSSTFKLSTPGRPGNGQ